MNNRLFLSIHDEMGDYHFDSDRLGIYFPLTVL